MDRKEFIKTSCGICLFIGTGFFLSPLSSCSNLSVFKTSVNKNTLVVSLSLFDTTNLQIVRAKELDYDIAIQKQKDGSFIALLMRCTHADNGVNYTGSGYICNLHGSTFDAKGNVTQGPAERPLKQMKIEVNSTNIIIHL